MRGELFKKGKRPAFLAVVVITVVFMLVFNVVLPLFNKHAAATSGTSISKTSTADWNQGTVSNLNTASDEMKMTPNAQTAWYQTGGTWDYRKKITLDHTSSPSVDRTNVAVKVDIASDADLASKAQDDGDDLLVTGEDETTKLTHQIEAFNGGTGALVLWVIIPTLSHVYDTTVYLYYGNASCSSQQGVVSNKSAATGGTVTTDGNYTVNSFTTVGSATFAPVNNGNIAYLAVGGGGGGGVGFDATHGGSGGGGGGAVVEDAAYAATAGSYAVVVGSGGPSHTVGVVSSFGAASAAGGGRGATYTGSAEAGGNGGSGGGGNGTPGGAAGAGGTGSPGYNGGAGWSSGERPAGGGGGGMGEVGDTAWYDQGGNGGDGIISTVYNGSNIYYGGGGGGGGWDNYNPPVSYNGAGGSGGGGAGSRTTAGVAGTDNTGGGGGGGNSAGGGAGGSGIVIVRYLTSSQIFSDYSLSSETAKSSVYIAGDNISTDWYNADWRYRRQIVIDHTKVPNTDQSEFPMLVKIIDAGDPVFTNAQADGDDILFTNIYSNTKFSHEIETFSTATHELWAWVKIPIIKTATDTTIWLYYGNSAATSQQNVTDVWSNGYVGVWHLKEASGNFADSTSSSNTGTDYVSATDKTGKIGPGQYFDGDDYIDSGQGSSLNFANNHAFSVELWFKTTAAQTTRADLITRADSVNDPYPGYVVALNRTTAGKLDFYLGNVQSVTNLGSNLNDNNWHQVSAIANGNNTVSFYIDGIQILNNVALTQTTNIAALNLMISRASLVASNYLTGNIDEPHISSAVRSADWIASEYANQNNPATFASIVAEEGYFPTSGSYYSPTSTAGGSGIIDTVWNGGWGTPNGFSSTVTIPTNTSINFQMRSSAVGGANDGDWTAWADLGTATTTGTFAVATAAMPAGITTGTNRYLQLKAIFIPDNQSAPTLSDYTVYYLADVDAPTNPTTVTATVGGSSVTSGTWTALSGAFNFVFSGAGDGGVGESGVAGYYIYLGTNASADPATYQAHVGALGDNQNYNSTIATSDDGKHFYFRVKTKDVAGNISAAGGLFDLAYDITLPTRPTFVAATPPGYTTVNSFSFTWPAGTDPNGPGGGASGIKWYQYKRGTDADWTPTANAEVRTATGITAYQEGANAFYVRTVDNADNISSNYQQVTYYWSGTAPAKPTGLTVTPDTSDTNSFTIHWHKPAVDPEDPPIVGYYYSINAAPTIGNVTYKASTADITTIGPDAYATLQGTNTVYVLSVNSAGNLSYEVAYVATATFTCITPAPPTPVSVSLYDSSDRTLSRWMLTIQWVAGAGQDSATFSHYAIYRSTDGLGFSLLATTISTAYIDDSGLNNSTTYYYNIKAVDNAGKESAQSSTVSKMPTGNYTVPPTILSAPVVSNIKSSSATISWTTNRASSSIVRYGTSNNGTFSASTGDLNAVINHTVTLLGLSPGMVHYFQVQSLDEDRDYAPDLAYSITYSFTTGAAPAISETKVSNITLTTADISFSTTTVATSTINYGTTNSYGTEVSDVSGAQATNHLVKLTGLVPGTTYHFKISGVDIDGNTLTSDDYQFDTLPLPKIENLKVEAIPGKPQSAFKASWTTNVPTTTILRYRYDSAEWKESVKAMSETSHAVEINGLLDDSDYQIIAAGRDSLGNLAESEIRTFRTPEDTRPPEISDVQIETSNVGSGQGNRSQIAVFWKTDEPATSKIEFGTDIEGAYTAATQEDTSFVLEHTVIVSDLESSNPYHLKAISKDKAGNLAESSSQTFITGEAKKGIWDLILETLRNIFGFIDVTK